MSDSIINIDKEEHDTLWNHADKEIQTHYRECFLALEDMLKYLRCGKISYIKV